MICECGKCQCQKSDNIRELREYYDKLDNFLWNALEDYGQDFRNTIRCQAYLLFKEVEKKYDPTKN